MPRFPRYARPPRQLVVLVFAVVVSVALLVAGVFGNRGLLHLWSLKAEESAINQRIAGLLHDNHQSRNQLRRLRSDDAHLERLAREQLGFVKPGEIVYRFPADASRNLRDLPR